MATTSTSFRVGKARADLRGRAWYLGYHDNGRRWRPRVGPDRDAARRLDPQASASLQYCTHFATSFTASEPGGIWYSSSMSA